MVSVTRNGKHYVYLAVPKTGSSTMHGLLVKSFKGKGVKIRDSHDSDPTKCNEYVKGSLVFTNIRHPLTLVKSWWNHIIRPQYQPREHVIYDIERQMRQQDDQGAQAFMERMVSNCPTFLSELFTEYIQNCTFVGATELYYETISQVFGLSPGVASKLVYGAEIRGVVNEFGFRVTPEVVDQFLINEKEAVGIWHSVIAGKWRNKI